MKFNYSHTRLLRYFLLVILCDVSVVAALTPLASRGGVDIDGDGRAELVVRNSQGGTLLGRLNSMTNQFSFTSQADPGLNYRYVGLLDINGNGTPRLPHDGLSKNRISTNSHPVHPKRMRQYFCIRHSCMSL